MHTQAHSSLGIGVPSINECYPNFAKGHRKNSNRNAPWRIKLEYLLDFEKLEKTNTAPIARFVELDNKIKRKLDLIEDNGDTFAKRAEMYYQKRPELVKMVRDLHGSYRALADKYDQLKSEPSIKASKNGLVSNSFTKVQSLQDCVEGKPHNNPSVEAPNFNSESIEEFSAAGSESAGTSCFEFQSPNNFMSINSSNKLMNKGDSMYYNNKNDFTMREHGLMIREKVWNGQMKFPFSFSKLLGGKFV